MEGLLSTGPTLSSFFMLTKTVSELLLSKLTVAFYSSDDSVVMTGSQGPDTLASVWPVYQLLCQPSYASSVIQPSYPSHYCYLTTNWQSPVPPCTVCLHQPPPGQNSDTGHVMKMYIYCNALYCTALHFSALHCTALHCTELNCTVMHCTAL